ncbi:MAG: type I-E CRISPR-associated protein Cas6/Cse3/CasE [Hyphomicrobiaceae bacterium]
MTTQFLSRARLRASRGEALSAIAPLLVPDDPSKRAGHAHRVLWLLFQDVPDAQRDFLWRDDGNGRYLILSARPPSDPLGLFELETKSFEPSLSVGDRLAFTLRANPVLASKAALDAKARTERARGKRVDVVMHALKDVAKAERKSVRDAIAVQAGTGWLAAQGARAGFTVPEPPHVDGYAQIPIERRRGRPAGFSVLDFKGVVEVADPAVFLDKLARGFGSAKAFGCGLMLIRRA